MSLISLVYQTKHIICQNLGEIGEMPCPTLFGGYVERLLIIHVPKLIFLSVCSCDCLDLCVILYDNLPLIMSLMYETEF